MRVEEGVTLAERSLPWEAEIQRFLHALPAGHPALPLPEALVQDPALPDIYSPVSAYRSGPETIVFFAAGEYDRDDARLLSVIARYKALVLPRCRAVFLAAPVTGDAVSWLGEPTAAAALLAAVYHAGSMTRDPEPLAQACRDALHNLFGVAPGRMQEGLAQIDQVLEKEIMPLWKQAQESQDLLRPLVRALNYLLRKALDEGLPAESPPEEPLMKERVRLWQQGGHWFRFQSQTYIEDLFRKRQPGLAEVYQALYTLTQNPAALVDRVRFRVLSAPADPNQPNRVPFAAAGESGSSLRGDFLFARRALLDQHGVTVPDLAWSLAECPACRTRTRFRQEADPLTLYRVSQAMDRLKQMIMAGRSRATFYCTACRQPLGFEHVVLAAYAHFLPDQDRDLHFLNERRPGRRRTFIQLLSAAGVSFRAMAVTDQAVAAVIGRPLSPLESWRALLEETENTPLGRELGAGFIGLALPPLDSMKFNNTVAKFYDQLIQKETSFLPLTLEPREENVPEALDRQPWFPEWLGDLKAKVSEETGYKLVAFINMDRIESLFTRAAQKLNLALRRSLAGTLEINGPHLTIPVDLKKIVASAIHHGHFPGEFVVREAGYDAQRLWVGERTIKAIQDYLGPAYSIQYSPPTAEVTIEGPSGKSAHFPLDRLIQDWTQNQAQARRFIIGKVGG